MHLWKEKHGGINKIPTEFEIHIMNQGYEVEGFAKNYLEKFVVNADEVYSGEAKNLKARAREHMSGHSKTACLALSNYGSLRAYIWRFYFSPCPSFEDPNESKLLRTLGEQAWRSKHGWPILCRK